jgi:hypothetical protein
VLWSAGGKISKFEQTDYWKAEFLLMINGLRMASGMGIGGCINHRTKGWGLTRP